MKWLEILNWGIFLKKKNWNTSNLFVWSMMPLFWTFGDVCPGIQSQDGSFACMPPYLHTMDFSDSPLARHMLTSLRFCCSPAQHCTKEVRNKRVSQISALGNKLYHYILGKKCVIRSKLCIPSSESLPLRTVTLKQTSTMNGTVMSTISAKSLLRCAIG